jgi:hypothetical protein
MCRSPVILCAPLVAVLACGTDHHSVARVDGSSGSAGSGTGASADSSSGGATPITTTAGSGTDSGGSGGVSAGGAAGSNGLGCLDEHEAGDRYSAGDGCNFCECAGDGTSSCTERSCEPGHTGCTYDGVDHPYAERFPSTDGCNECVCAASGLACTRRSCDGALSEGGTLVESLDEECGVSGFTAHSVLEGLPHPDLVVPFLYDRAREDRPETLADTSLRLRVVYDEGFVACYPAPGQERFDIDIVLEWITADGAFNEGVRGYLRRQMSAFTDVWTVLASLPATGLAGTYDAGCGDTGDLVFNATFDADGSVTGAISKDCGDVGYTVGEFELASGT